MEHEKLRFAKTHEWANLEDNTCTVGLSQFAVDQLSDIMHIDLPDIDDPAIQGEPFGEIESVKAVSDLYSPVDGEVVEVNSALPDKLEMLNSDPYGGGWLVKIKITDEAALKNLMDYSTYQKTCAEEGH